MKVSVKLPLGWWRPRSTFEGLGEVTRESVERDWTPDQVAAARAMGLVVDLHHAPPRRPDVIHPEPAAKPGPSPSRNSTAAPARRRRRKE